MGEVETVTEKFGLGAVIAALGVLLGKYFAFRPKTIEAQAAARKSDIQTLQDSNADVIKQITENNKEYVSNLKQIHCEHVANLMATINDLQKTAALQRARADRTESILANSRETKHSLAQTINVLHQQLQWWDGLLTDGHIEHDKIKDINVAALYKAEDAANKLLTDSAVVTSQAAVTATL